jgi:pyridoxine 5-phosphate synthase
MIRLGVNIDHVATVRQARRTVEPDPVQAAVLAELGGAQSITVHLREDRRHIQDRDVRLLRQTLKVPLNLEMGCTEEMLGIALALRPQHVCLVPEKREELTTEGGLALSGNDLLPQAVQQLQANGTQVSLFIEPDPETICLASELGAQAIELHTGTWANAWLAAGEAGAAADHSVLHRQLDRLEAGAALAAERHLICNAGHGILYHNVRELLHLPGLHELNIGHTIIAKALLVGMERAVREMRQLLEAAPSSPHPS